MARCAKLLETLLAELRQRSHGRLHIFARIEFARVFLQHAADLAGHRHAAVGIDVDLAHAILDAALDLFDRHAPGRLHLAAIFVDDLLQFFRNR